LLTLSHCVMWLSVASYILVFFLLCTRRPPLSPLFPYTTLFRSRDLGGSFRSLRDTLMHIIGGEWGWLAYWKASSHSAAFLADLWDRHDALFHPDGFPNLSTVRLKWDEVEKEQTEFVSSLTEETLRKMFPIRSGQLSLTHLMQHLANHSTYHRGQVALMMRLL